MRTRDDYVGIIQGLLAKAGAEGVTEGEARSLEEKACALMLKYSIDRALCEKAEGTPDLMGSTLIFLLNPYAGDQSTLISVIAKSLNCSSVTLNRDFSVDTEHPHDKRSHVFGYSKDREMVQLMYLTLWLEATNRLMHSVCPPGTHGRAWNNAFIKGFVVAINDRLQIEKKRATQEAESSAPGTELLLVTREMQSKASLAGQYPNTRTVKRSYSSRAGFAAGNAAGYSAALHNKSQMGGRSFGALGSGK